MSSSLAMRNNRDKSSCYIVSFVPGLVPSHLHFRCIRKASVMSSSSLTVYPHLPPTTNILDSQQRTRLIRSTRKLGSLLGTTPCLLENDTSYAILPLGRTTSRALKRQGSIFTHRQISSLSVASSSTSTTSLAHRPCPSVPSVFLSQTTDSPSTNPPGLSTTRGRRLGDRPTQLYLRLDTVPVSPTDERLAPLPSPRTPVTPTVPDVGEVHRKRMAKLAHHLGENIPVELVLPAQSESKPATIPRSRPQGRRSQSVQVMRTQAARVSDNRPSIEQSRQDWVGEWNRSNIGDVQKELRKLKIG